jgi:diguanylate cyclase
MARGFTLPGVVVTERSVLVEGYGTGGLLMIDPDDLKGINDGLGHAMGDIAIRAVADRTRESIRAGDAAYRIGGDEFAVITRAPGLDGFGARLADVLARIAGPDCVFSASVGWAAREPDDTSGALVERADENLYANKLV